MQRYHVFDCTRAVGIACTVPTALLASIIAKTLTLATGSYHLYWEVNTGTL